MDLSIQVVERSGRTVLLLAGELDVASAPALRRHLVEVLADGPVDLVADLSGVSFIDSSGLGILVGGVRRTRARGGDLVLCGLEGNVRDVVELTGLDRAFTVRATLEEALAGGG